MPTWFLNIILSATFMVAEQLLIVSVIIESIMERIIVVLLVSFISNMGQGMR